MEFIDVIWFTGLQTVGIVIGKDETTGKIKAYIGVGKGYNEKADIRKIMNHGNRIQKHQAMRLANLIDKE